MKLRSYDWLYERTNFFTCHCFVCNEDFSFFRLKSHMSRHIKDGKLAIVGGVVYMRGSLDELLTDLSRDEKK